MDSLMTIYFVHCVSGIFAYLFNLLLIVIILSCKGNEIGFYRYLLLIFTISNLGYPTINILIAPTGFTYHRSFVYDVTTRFIPDYSTKHVILLVYCTYYCQSLLLLMFHFLYRYISVCHNHLVNLLHKPSTLFSIFAFNTLIILIWALVSHIAMTPTQEQLRYLEPSFKEKYGISLYKVPAVGGYFEPFNLLGEPQINWRPYIGKGIVFLIMGGSCTVITVCGLKIYRVLELLQKNRKTAQIQRDLFRALLVQTAIPLLLSYTPCFILYTCGIFGIPLPLDFVSICIAFEPVFEPLSIMYFVKEYRSAVLNRLRQTLGMRKRPSNAISSQTNGGAKSISPVM